MPIEITMPRLSDTMEVGTILHWHVNVGDEVSAGDVLADIETDKATMELQSFDDGRILEIMISVGDKVRVGTTIALLAEEDEPIVEEDQPKPDSQSTVVVQEPSAQQRVSPIARKLAEEYGVDLSAVQGTGPSGRIIKRDILQIVAATDETTAAAHTIKTASSTDVVASTTPMSPAQPLVPTSPWQQDRSEPLSNIRQIIAKRLVESKQTIPHYQVTMVFDMDPLLNMRKTLNEQLQTSGVKLSVNDFLIRCCALSMATQSVIQRLIWG